jgi:hypothetical protein
MDASSNSSRSQAFAFAGTIRVISARRLSPDHSRRQTRRPRSLIRTNLGARRRASRGTAPCCNTGGSRGQMAIWSIRLGRYRTGTFWRLPTALLPESLHRRGIDISSREQRSSWRSRCAGCLPGSAFSLVRPRASRARTADPLIAGSWSGMRLNPRSPCTNRRGYT